MTLDLSLDQAKTLEVSVHIQKHPWSHFAQRQLIPMHLLCRAVHLLRGVHPHAQHSGGLELQLLTLCRRGQVVMPAQA